MGLIRMIFRGGMMTLGGMGMCVCVCATTLIAIGWGINAAQQATIERNGGFGTQENRIASGNWIRFEDFSVRVVEVIWDGTGHPDLLDGLDPAATGSVYMMVWFELDCHRPQGECFGHEFGVWLIDAQGREWQEPPNILVFSNHDLDFEEALGGNVISGWQIFEVPTNADILTMRVQHEGINLHAYF